LSLNAEYADKWPNITIKREPPPDASQIETEDGKFEKYFSSEPGQGD
jgi:ferredoxin